MDEWPRPRLRSYSYSDGTFAHAPLSQCRSDAFLEQPQRVGRSISFRQPRTQPPHHVINNPHPHRKLSKREAALAARRKRYSVEALDFSHLDTRDISSFLRHIRLHKYTEILERANISFENLLAIDDEGLTRAGISAVGARTRLLKAIERYNECAEARRNGVYMRSTRLPLHAQGDRYHTRHEHSSALHGTSPKQHYISSMESRHPQYPAQFMRSSQPYEVYSSSAPILDTGLFAPSSWTNSSFSTDSDDEDFDGSDEEDDGADLLSHVAEAAEQLLHNMVESESGAHSQMLASFEKLSVIEPTLHTDAYVNFKAPLGGPAKDASHMQWPPNMHQYARRRTISASHAVWAANSDFWNASVPPLSRREISAHMPMYT